jgi:hypothetical protein
MSFQCGKHRSREVDAFLGIMAIPAIVAILAISFYNPLQT